MKEIGDGFNFFIYDTPLHFAAENGHFEVVKYILSFPNVKVQIKNKI